MPEKHNYIVLRYFTNMKYCYVPFSLWCTLDINERSLILALLTLTLWPSDKSSQASFSLFLFIYCPSAFFQAALQFCWQVVLLVTMFLDVRGSTTPFLASNWPFLYLNQEVFKPQRT